MICVGMSAITLCATKCIVKRKDRTTQEGKRLCCGKRETGFGKLA